MKKINIQYTVIYKSEPEGGFTALVPALPGCISYGRDLPEAKKMAADAIKGYIFSLRKHKSSIPQDTDTFIGSIQFSANKSFVCA